MHETVRLPPARRKPFARRRRLAAALALASCAAGARGFADDFPDVVCTDMDSIWVILGRPGGEFEITEKYYIGDGVEPWSVAIGDLTGDGLPEIVSANRFGPHVAVFWNSGRGEFESPPSLVSTPERPYDVDLGDLDRDGSLDIVVTCNYDPGEVLILYNDGLGGIARSASLRPGGETFHSVLVDLDGANGLDLVVSRNGAGDLAVYRNRGDGELAFFRNVPAVTDPKALKAGDFDADGKADVALVNDSGGRVAIFLGDGSGGLEILASYAAGVQPRELSIVDLDGDGASDLVVAGGRGSNYVSRFLGNGDGTFRDRADFSTGPRPNSVDSADFDLDGLADIAVANWSLDNPSLATLSILYGDGAGGFRRKADLVPPQGFQKITALAAGQLDQASFVRGDVVEDRRIDITDAIAILNYLFATGSLTCLDAADIDDNSELQITDPIVLLTWLFLVGEQPSPPFPRAGVDPTPDHLGCRD